MTKTNWMSSFEKQLKIIEGPYKKDGFYRSDEEVELKLEKLKQHFSTEAFRLSKSTVVRALIASFYETVFKKEK